MKKVLVLNAGSSSLKFKLFDIKNKTYGVIAKGNAERVGLTGSFIEFSINGKKKEKKVSLKTHEDAMNEILAELKKEVLRDPKELAAVGHRVVHGGEEFSKSVVITDKVVKTVERLIPLAPLHNPANLLGIKAVKKLLPKTPQTAVFDTAFHQTMKKESFLYPLPLDQYEKHKIRRYGFHGTSHRYVSEQAAKLIGKKGKIITCHLGNGASICAVEKGKSIDTSMGFTPVAGIMMGTRCGDIDPYIPLHLIKNGKMSVDAVDKMMNKESGLLGLSGHADMRDVEAQYLKGDRRAVDTVNVYVHAVVKFIGQYAAVLGGADAIVFTAGVGEYKPFIRKLICEKLAFMGIKFDSRANQKQGKQIELSKRGSKTRVFVIPTDEELMIAKDTMGLVK